VGDIVEAIVVGLVLGSIYAIAASGLVITYVSTGVLNFAFGAMAFTIARLYYFLHTETPGGPQWGILPAVFVSLFVAAPLLGILLYLLVFRLLRLSSQLVKIVCTIGVSVALPALVQTLVDTLIGTHAIFFVPGLAPQPVETFDVLGVTLNLDQVIVLGSVALTLAVGGLVLRYTPAGLKVRGLVDSEAMTGLSGTNPRRVSIGVWVVSAFMAGLAGVLLAPTVNLDAGKFTLLTAAAFAAVVAARLRSVVTAVVVGLLMGVADQLLQKYMPHDQTFWGKLTPYLRPSIPFFFIAVFLLYFLLRSGRVAEETAVGGPLDHAIRPQGGDRSVVIVEDENLPPRVRATFQYGLPMLAVVVFAVLAAVLNPFWGSLVALGAAYAIIMLSYTLVTGEGGMIWLCQITFAAVGAMATAALTTDAGWPLVLSLLAAGAIAAIFGMLIGALTIRLGDLYVALVTLTFALLMDQLVFQQVYFAKGGTGIALLRPDFANGDQAFSYLVLGVFCVLALVVYNVRKSTAGMSLSAVRWSEPAARMLGVSVVQMKMLVAGLAAFVAALGGVFLAMYGELAQPDLFATFTGLVWLAVLVNFGIRSNAAALLAGMILAFVPNLLSSYLPEVLGVPTGSFLPMFFGLGAVLVAKNPDGVLADNGRRLQARIARRYQHADPSEPPAPPVPEVDRPTGTEPGPEKATLGGAER
jgi:branched-chain amino acid transport system permease protein